MVRGDLPDVRDGLTRLERVVLVVLRETQAELGGRNVPTAMLYGRVAEIIDASVDELQAVLDRLVGSRAPSAEDPARPQRPPGGARRGPRR
jgi:hypothetical protein